MSAQFRSMMDRSHAGSMVIAQQGIVATEHVLASQAGARILARGGSAIDAAIAANAVLGVTEPMMCGIGGDLFALYWDAGSGELTGLNASGWAPRGLTAQFLEQQEFKEMPGKGIHSATVPGAVDGWAKLHGKFGKLPWEELFQAAIHYAEEGYPVPETLHAAWQGDPDNPAPFLVDGKTPQVGGVYANRRLAAALRLLAGRGRDVFYEGEIAEAILATSRKAGGTMAPEDLAEYSARWVEPVSISYRGWKIYELPPNGQGMAALQILNMLEALPALEGGPNTAADLHRKIEATKLAYADMRRYVADPLFAKPPVDELLSKAYAAKRAALIDPAKANCDVPPGEPVAGDTSYLAAVDKEGNIVSMIQSIGRLWGSGVVVEGMGFPLHNRAAGFTLEPDHPNRLEGRKRPRHSIIPAFMERDGRRIGFGIMSGPNQPLAHMQFVSNLVDHGMNLQQALSAPRFTKYTPSGCDVMIETRIPLDVLRELSAKGHQLELRAEYSMLMGRGQAVLHDSNARVNYAASSPRADGAAIPEPLP